MVSKVKVQQKIMLNRNLHEIGTLLKGSSTVLGTKKAKQSYYENIL